MTWPCSCGHRATEWYMYRGKNLHLNTYSYINLFKTCFVIDHAVCTHPCPLLVRPCLPVDNSDRSLLREVQVGSWGRAQTSLKSNSSQLHSWLGGFVAVAGCAMKGVKEAPPLCTLVPQPPLVSLRAAALPPPHFCRASSRSSLHQVAFPSPVNPWLGVNCWISCYTIWSHS